jgi:putative restriction endonuclease
MASGVNQYERAYRAWPFLTAAAAAGTTVTYSELANALGIHHRPIRYILAVIQDWCLDEKKPPLTILVVSQDRGEPGQGFIAWDTSDLAEGYKQVYSFPWTQVANPFAFAGGGATPEQLAHRLVIQPGDAGEIYGRIQNRGFAQVVFRLALLAAYGRRCAFCGLGLTDALEAAHIIPWSKASFAERVLPSNGLLLCATHHSLFDAGILTVTPDRTIRCRQDRLSGHPWNEADRRASMALDGKAMALPADTRHYPSHAALAYRASS